MNDANETTPSESLFQHLVAMLATSALQQLGLMQGAEGQGANLEAASMTIDLLDVLQDKTQGNLTDDEAAMLKESLSSLKMAFVQIRQGPPREAETPEEQDATAPETSPTEAPEGATPDLQVPDATKEKKQPKFHKKYE